MSLCFATDYSQKTGVVGLLELRKYDYVVQIELNQDMIERSMKEIATAQEAIKYCTQMIQEINETLFMLEKPKQLNINVEMLEESKGDYNYDAGQSF
jgi:hypothetical protein